MNIAFIGSHGTGKTTTLELISNRRPEWAVVREATRHIMPILGYQNPYNYVEDFGIAFYENLVIGQWCILDKKFNTLNADVEKTMLIDRSPIDNLAYYFLHRQKNELKYEEILTKLTKYYISFIDMFIYFPVSKFELYPDEMQKKETQKDYDSVLLNLLVDFKIAPYHVNELDVNLRADEIVKIIDKRLSND
jgi:predicted ATPase